jgi:hypothetical protein
MTFTITEHLDYQDFMEANFPDVLGPFYTKRIILINIIFALMFIGATIYMFVQSIKNGIKIGGVHYSYIFFSLVFSFLSIYINKREKKVYQELVKDINNLKTTYEFSETGIKVQNKTTQLNYHRNEIKTIDELDKWYIIHFKNNEKLTIYKPNIGNKELDFKKLYKI